MTREELLDKAIYIQYPLNYSTYKQYDVGKEIHKLPLPERGMMYNGWQYNINHFVPTYHRKYSLPLLEELFKFGYDENDFILKERKFNWYDLSILYPKKEQKYEIYGFNDNEHFDNLSYDDIMTSKAKFINATAYHKQYKYPHSSSRLINKTLESNRVLFISGDSHMIPDVLVLSCYFKEIWYMDNRDKLSLGDKWKNITFTDVLIELNWMNQEQYNIINFK